MTFDLPRDLDLHVTRNVYVSVQARGYADSNKW